MVFTRKEGYLAQRDCIPQHEYPRLYYLGNCRPDQFFSLSQIVEAYQQYQQLLQRVVAYTANWMMNLACFALVEPGILDCSNRLSNFLLLLLFMNAYCGRCPLVWHEKKALPAATHDFSPYENLINNR